MTWLASVRLTIDYYYYYDIFRYSCLLYIPHFTFILCCYNKYSVSFIYQYFFKDPNFKLTHTVQITTEKVLYDLLIHYSWCQVLNMAATYSPIKGHQAADISLLLKRWRIVWVNNTDIAMSWWILRITKQFIIYFPCWI